MSRVEESLAAPTGGRRPLADHRGDRGVVLRPAHGGDRRPSARHRLLAQRDGRDGYHRGRGAARRPSVTPPVGELMAAVGARRGRLGGAFRHLGSERHDDVGRVIGRARLNADGVRGADRPPARTTASAPRMDRDRHRHGGRRPDHRCRCGPVGSIGRRRPARRCRRAVRGRLRNDRIGRTCSADHRVLHGDLLHDLRVAAARGLPGRAGYGWADTPPTPG